MTEPTAPRPLVDYGRLLDAIGIEGELMAAAAHGAPTDAPVPGSPDSSSPCRSAYGRSLTPTPF